MMEIRYACRVEKGRRDTNDDRVFVGGNIANMNAFAGEDHAPLLAAVCDGCGGYAGGGIAAQTVLEVLSGAAAQEMQDTEKLAAVLEDCRLAVYQRKAEMPEYRDMCTTIAGCLIGEESTVIFHAGDSRVYRFDGYNLAKMTVDHSLVQEMIDMGKITPEEAYASMERGVINRCIGIECLPPEINVFNSKMTPGEIYLLCSDGLWEYVDEKKIFEILSQEADLAELADRLVQEAIVAGSDDNTSVCLCKAPGERNVTAEEDFVLD